MHVHFGVFIFHLFYNLHLLYCHLVEILWLFIFLVFYKISFHNFHLLTSSCISFISKSSFPSIFLQLFSRSFSFSQLSSGRMETQDGASISKSHLWTHRSFISILLPVNIYFAFHFS